MLVLLQVSNLYTKGGIIIQLPIYPSPSLNNHKGFAIFVSPASWSLRQILDLFCLVCCSIHSDQHPSLKAQVFPYVAVSFFAQQMQLAGFSIPALSSFAHSSRLSLKQSVYSNPNKVCVLHLVVGFLKPLKSGSLPSTPSPQPSPTKETRSGVLWSIPCPRCVWWFHQRRPWSSPHHELEGGFTVWTFGARRENYCVTCLNWSAFKNKGVLLIIRQQTQTRTAPGCWVMWSLL